MDFLYKVFHKSTDSEEIQPTPIVTKQCNSLSEERIRSKLNLYNNSIEVYVVTCALTFMILILVLTTL